MTRHCSPSATSVASAPAGPEVSTATKSKPRSASPTAPPASAPKQVNDAASAKTGRRDQASSPQARSRTPLPSTHRRNRLRPLAQPAYTTPQTRTRSRAVTGRNRLQPKAPRLPVPARRGARRHRRRRLGCKKSRPAPRRLRKSARQAHQGPPPRARTAQPPPRFARPARLPLTPFSPATICL